VANAEEEWRETARLNSAVATTLRRLPERATARLLHHSYVLAMINLHVILGYPLLDVPTREHFSLLLASQARG
jgi:hypothetical protein